MTHFLHKIVVQVITIIHCFKHNYTILPFSSVLCLVYNKFFTFDMHVHVRVSSHPYMWILEGTQHAQNSAQSLKMVRKTTPFRHSFVHVRCCIAHIRPNIVSTR